MFFTMIISIFIAWWIYQTCVRSGITPWKPILACLISFYLSMRISHDLLFDLLIGKSQVNQHSIGYGMTVQFSSILAGLLVVFLVQRLFVRKA
jgi:hypothetical protein